jgi:hypothetical protein
MARTNQISVRFSEAETAAIRAAAKSRDDGTMAQTIRAWVLRQLRKRGLLDGHKK